MMWYDHLCIDFSQDFGVIVLKGMCLINLCEEKNDTIQIIDLYNGNALWTFNNCGISDKYK